MRAHSQKRINAELNPPPAGQAYFDRRARRGTPSTPGYAVSYDGNLRGVLACNSYDDLTTAAMKSLSGQRASVIGSGPIAIAAAVMLAEQGLRTTLLSPESDLMPGSATVKDRQSLYERLMESNIDVRTGARVKCLRGDDRITCVRLIGDYLIPTDILILTPENAVSTH